MATDPITDWNSDYSIGFLPQGIKDLFRERADSLYHDLRSNRLEVILVPAPFPKHQDHMIRVVASQNPQWYQELYRSYPQQLRRPHSLRALDRIRNVRDPEFSPNPTGAIQHNFKYVSLYREVIFEMLVFGYGTNGLYVPAERKAQEFFGVEGIDEVLIHPF